MSEQLEYFLDRTIRRAGDEIEVHTQFLSQHPRNPRIAYQVLFRVPAFTLGLPAVRDNVCCQGCR